MPDRKTPDQKLLARIERAIKKYSRNDTNASGYIFPNGAVYFLKEDHFIVAKNIFKSLRIDVDNIHPLQRLLSLGMLRFALVQNITSFGVVQRTFVVNSGTPSSAAENAILDVAAGQRYNEVAVHLDGKKREEYMKRKLEKGMSEF